MLFLSDVNEIWIFWTDFRKISNVMKIIQKGTELFHADGQAGGEMTKLIVTCNFANAPTN
jgi:hypothetical protein